MRKANMSRWFRLYDDTLNDPKILKLSDKTYRVWIGILCIASKHDGALPPFEDMALLLRMRHDKLQPELEKLIAAGLVDHDDEGLRPHNWQGRQFKSDVSNDRVKRHRERQRNAQCNVTETPPETEADTDTDTESDKREGGASAPAKPKRATAFPKDFVLDDELLAIADRHGIPAARAQGVFDHFREHHIARGTTFKDWKAAWSTWCRNDKKFNGRPPIGGRNGTATRKDEWIAAQRAAGEYGRSGDPDAHAVSEGWPQSSG